MRNVRLLGLAVLVAAIGLFGVAQLYKVEIGERIFKRAVKANVGRDLLAGQSDGLHVILLGSGSPMADPSRAGPSTAVIAGERVFVIDAGSGAARNMAAFGLSPGLVERVFLTHFHSDHIDGLGELMLQRWAGGARAEPLPVYGPQGVEQVVSGFNMAYGLDKGYRIAHHGEDIVPPGGFGGEARTFESDAETVVLEEDGLRITAFPVEHAPVSPAVGYRFDYKGRAVTITGDTAPFQSLVTYARDSDILISEALNREMVAQIQAEAEANDLANVAKIMADIPDYHMTPVDAAETAQAGEVRMLVLNHIVPALPSAYLDSYFIAKARQHYSGKFIVGQDGMMFSLPVEKKKIVRKSLK